MRFKQALYIIMTSCEPVTAERGLGKREYMCPAKILSGTYGDTVLQLMCEAEARRTE
jgi:hypothetical protein